MMKIGAVMLYVDAMGATETRDWGTYFVLADPEGNRLRVYQLAG